MQSTQNWEPELRRIAVAWSHGDENYQTLVSFIRSVEEKSMEREWKRCIDVLDREHSKCPIPESCIGYQNAQSDLINNHPKQAEINIWTKENPSLKE